MAPVALTRLELTTLLEEFYPFEPLQNVALYGDGAGAFKAAVLGHKIGGLRARQTSGTARSV
jgi:hypothetical protein